jgi:hypothetical protein
MAAMRNGSSNWPTRSSSIDHAVTLPVTECYAEFNISGVPEYATEVNTLTSARIGRRSGDAAACDRAQKALFGRR